MGIAIIVPGISFAGANLGTVTPTSGGQITALEISGPDTVRGALEAAEYTPIYTPSDTSQRSVTWSVESGQNYAAIDAATGVLSVLPGASYAQVTIRCRSTVNLSIFASKTITVSYASSFLPLEDLTARMNFPFNGGNGGYYITNITPADDDYLKVKFTCFTARLSFVIGSRKLSTADDDSFTAEYDANGKFIAKVGGKKFTSGSSFVTGTTYTVTAKLSGVTSSPSLGTFTEAAYSFTSGYPLVIGGIGYENSSVGYNTGPGDIYGIEIYASNDTLKHRLIPQSDLTFVDEVTGRVYQKSGGGSVAYADN